MAESALRQYEYGRGGLLGVFAPVRREIISPAQSLPMGYTSARRGVGVKQDEIPAQYGEPEISPTYAPAYRGLRSALHALYDFGQDPMGTIRGIIQSAPEVAESVDQYMRDQYTAGALGGIAYNPETGQVTEFDPTIAMVGGAPAGVQAVRAATPGTVTLGSAGGKIDLPPLSNAQKTQLGASTIPSYEKAGALLGGGKTLDFGAGRGQGASKIGADTFEPYPREGFNPTYTQSADIPDASYDNVTSLNVLNVMPRDVRDQAVSEIGRVLRPGGKAIVTTRGRDVMSAKGPEGPEPMSRITTSGTYQKGFTQPELREYTASVLGPDYTVDNLPEKIGQAGVMITRNPSATLRSGSKRGTGVAAASALTGDYRDRIIQEYPKSYRPAIIENYVSQGVDPRTFAAGAGDNAGDPRMGQLNILGGTTVNIGDQRIGNVPRINLADYEGYPFFTSMADRAAAGDVILDINGVPINVSRRGGQNYMLDPESGEFVWASDEDVVLKSKGGELSDTSFFKTAKDLKEKYGKDPLIVPWTMAPTGIDFSTQIGETMLSYARNSMSRGDLASLDKDVKKIIPEWPGIDNPEWVASFRNTTGNQRKAVENLLDRNYVDKGGITSGIARYANIDSDLRMARDGQLVNAGIVDTGRYPLTDTMLVHPTYNTGLYGQGLGRIAGDIQVFELLPDARALMGIIDPLNPPRNALRALEMKPYGGVITESALRAIEDRRR